MIKPAKRPSASRFAGVLTNPEVRALLEEFLSAWDELERTLVRILGSLLGDGEHECADSARELFRSLGNRPDRADVLLSLLDEYPVEIVQAGEYALLILEFRLLAKSCRDYRDGIWTTSGNDRDLFLREPGRASFDGFVGARQVSGQDVRDEIDRTRRLRLALIEAIWIDPMRLTRATRVA